MMLVKFLAVFLVAIGLLVATPALAQAPTPSIVIGRNIGPVGTPVVVSGSNFAASEVGIAITFDGTPVVTGIAASTAGAWSTSFAVPATASGSHIIDAYGATTTAASVPDQTFVVTPAIAINRLSGPSGTPVSITGSGFAANDSVTVTFDGTTVASGITASFQGSWGAAFNVPASAGGTHTIAVTATATAGIPALTFNIIPGISSNRTSGSSGTSVTITGSGFVASETGITVTYDGTTVASGITASATGSWSATFNVPPSAGGSHTITASGASTLSFNVPNLSFSITPTLSISRTSGSPGTSITVTGSGFGANETGITVTYDGNPVASGISAGATGSWTATFNVPASASGAHPITAYGSSTPAGTAAAVNFTIGAGISSSRPSGTVGTSITITGSGFGAGETGIVITYDGTSVASGISANTTGAWSATFNAPASASGSHAIAAYGSSTQAGAISPISFTISPSMSINLASSSPGTSITVSGSGFGASETGISVTYDGASVASGISANTTGSWSATFNVPASALGPHVIDASGASTQAANVADLSFTVNPVITINRSSGAPGTSITVTGSGFGAGETGISITYDGASIASGVSANPTGSWSASFNVPASASGAHTIDASGASTRTATVPDLSFTVNPVITINRSSGAPGTSITVTGSGFGASETGISITYDGATVGSGISANPTGSWSATLNIPSSASGSHAISASGASTPSTSVPAVGFVIGASISSNRTSGPVGTSVTVTGSGFGASEASITVTYDGTPVTLGISASQQGSWSATFNTPASALGSHVIDAYGSSTQATSVSDLGFTINPSLSINPNSGYVGIKIEVTGSGFAANSRIPITYDGVEIPDAVATSDASGSFNLSVAAPKSKGGAHTIKAVDRSKGEAQASFAMETNPPPIPNLLSPKSGDRIGLLGGITPSLRWSNVEDPSGVTYILQIDTGAEFSDPILENSKLTSSSYTMTKDQALPRGTYYWRVKAIDSASNESAWSQPWLLSAGLMDLWTLILLIVVGIGMIGGAAYFLLIRRPRWRKAPAVAEGEVVSAPPSVYVRVFKPEEAPRLSPTAPPRRLLAQGAPAPLKPVEEEAPTEEHARAKMTVEFARSLPLVQPIYNVDWLVELVQLSKGPVDKTEVYRQLLQGEPAISYEPAWRKHPLYPDMVQALQGQPLLDDLDDFVDAAGRCASECIVLLQDIYRDALAEIPEDALDNGGWACVFGVYADALSWFRGKFLRQPSEQDYIVKTEASDVGSGICWLHGQDNTPFAGALIQALDNKQAFMYRDLHLGLRRNYRQSDKAKSVAEIIVQLDLLRGKLLRTLSRVDTTFDTP